jgi:hypothetical protein
MLLQGNEINMLLRTIPQRISSRLELGEPAGHFA